MNASTLTRAIDGVVVAALVAIAAWGFSPIFAGTGWLIAAGAGLVVGAAIAFVSAYGRWPIIPTAIAVLIGYVVVGGAAVMRSTTIAGVVPTLDTVRELTRGAVSTWMDLLTVDVPTEGISVVLLVPFITVLGCTSVGVSLAMRVRRAGWSLLPAVATLLVTILFGTYHGVAPVVQGAVFTAASIAWLAWRRERARGVQSSAQSRQKNVRRVAFASAMILLAVAGGSAWAVAASPQGQRTVLRDHVVPPLQLHDYPSPLQSFRHYVRDKESNTLFTVDGLPAGAMVRLATLDSYDGVVYAVSGDGTAVAGSFEKVGSVIPVSADGERATVTIEVGELTGVWLPTIGAVRSVTFNGANSTALERSLHYNRTTSTAVVTHGLQTGDQYTLDVVIPGLPTEDDLEDAAFAAISTPRISNVPEGLATIASEALEADTRPVAEVNALSTYLSASGFFSHGLEGQAPSRSGHSQERISALIGGDQMIGDDEQYAVTFALMAHELGIPARVVMGFEAGSGDGPHTITGDDVRVWAEVAYEGFGWVPVDPTPAEDRAPLDEDVPPQREPKPQVMQPPDPPREPPAVPPAVPVTDEAVDPPDDTLAAVLRIAVYVAAGIGVLLVLLGPVLGIVIAKARRRRKRRRTADLAARVAAGWTEIADAATDYGVDIPAAGTRVEKAVAIDAAVNNSATSTLALTADRLVWGPEDVQPEDADRFWASVGETVRTINRAHGFRRRMIARVSARSLVAHRRARKAERRR